MGVLLNIADRIAGGEITELQEAVDEYGKLIPEMQKNLYDVPNLQERIIELEQQLREPGWVQIGGGDDMQLSKATLNTIARTARIYWLKNPLIRRAVLTQNAYVFAQGVGFNAVDERVQTLIDEFVNNERNKRELTSHLARMQKETELQLDANIFFVLFTNRVTGRVRLASIPFAQIDEIISDPEDSKKPRYYLRSWSDSNGQRMQRAYPDFNYDPAGATEIEGYKIDKDAPIYHVKVNATSDMTYGVSEMFSAIDWARAYKEFLEDWSVLVRALSKYAYKITTKNGKPGVDAAVQKLSADFGPDPATGLPPQQGASWIQTDNYDIQAMPKSGATIAAEDGRHLKLMVCAATGIFEHYFGDPSSGNLATATAMERPMELQFTDRQTLWADVHKTIFDYVIDRAAIAAGYVEINGNEEKNAYGDTAVTIPPEIIKNEALGTIEEVEFDRSVEVTFPPIMEKSAKDTIDAIVSATTLDGNAPAGTIDRKTALEMMLNVLGYEDPAALADILFPDGVEAWDDQPATDDAAQEAPTFGDDDANALAEAIKALNEQFEV